MEDQSAPSVERLEAAVALALRRLGAARSGGVVALSGGPDSMALAVSCGRLAGRLGLTVRAAIVDHGARRESAAEAAQVLAWAQARGLDTEIVRLEVAPGPGFEARAREARYAALETVRAAHGLAWIFTGHTASDQAETLLMRLGRGAALAGAAGVLAKRGRVLRPLLGVTRAEVLAYVAALGLPVVADPMNDDPQFTRVRVRQGVVPALAQALGPTVERQLSRFATLAAEDEALLSGLAERARARLSAGAQLDGVGVAALEPPIARRVVVGWLEAHGLEVDAAVVAEVLEAVGARRTATLPADRVMRWAGPWLMIENAPPRH